MKRWREDRRAPERAQVMGRWVRRIAIGLTLAALAAVAVLCTPEPFFAHHMRVEAYDVWSDRPIPRGIGAVLEDATARLARSELYRPGERFRIFFCNDEWRLAVWSGRGSGKMGGAADTFLTGNVYLRRSDIDLNRLIPPSGWRATMADRPLSYYVAHELTHVMEMRAFGRGLLLRKPAWLNEGYADLIGKADRFDYAANRTAMLAGARELDPKASGLYRRYHLEVGWLLRHGRGIGELYAHPPRQADVDREIAADRGL
jgi:hypothetical protein